jgi:hypothetical protein
VIDKWLKMLAGSPFSELRAPGDCPGLPAEEHDRWRRVWADVDALSTRSSHK